MYWSRLFSADYADKILEISKHSDKSTAGISETSRHIRQNQTTILSDCDSRRQNDQLWRCCKSEGKNTNILMSNLNRAK